MDIVVTIPRSEYLNDERETNDLLHDPDLLHFWTLAKRPAHLRVGERVFFIKDGRVESSMRVVEIQMDSATRCETTGRIWSGRCQIFMDDLRVEQGPESRGFQGFRYRWW
jgi:hypothetical protein